MMVFGIAKARCNEIQVALLGLGPNGRFLLEAVEDVNKFLDSGCVNSPERITIEVRHDLNRINASHRLRGWMRLTKLCLAQSRTDLIPDYFGKAS
jgi:hypothetical protein